MSLITYMTRVHFADRALEDALPVEVGNLGVRRPLVLTDVVGESGDSYDRLVDALPSTCAVVALRGHAPQPTAREHAAATTTFSRSGCDGIVCLGGDGLIDFARLTVCSKSAGGDAPVIAVPTITAGMGLAPVRHQPAVEGPPRAPVPAAVICDPTLTTSAGADVTAAAGMDVLTHCLEAWLGAAFNPPADGIALEGLRRAAGSLERAVADGSDLEARRELMAAALCAGLAAQKGAGGVEALARAAEAEAGLVGLHGLLHAALLPVVLAFNAPAVADRLDQVRAALQLPAEADLGAALAALGARVALPSRLGRFGFDARARARIAATAVADPANRTNPRHATPADYLHLLEAAD
ncbi:MAG: iron-containing alcohol dehydrogenase [Pseudomonadota bacterium]